MVDDLHVTLGRLFQESVEAMAAELDKARARAERAEAEAAALRERVRRLERAADRLLELLYHGHATLTVDADEAAQELRVVLEAGDGR